MIIWWLLVSVSIISITVGFYFGVMWGCGVGWRGCNKWWIKTLDAKKEADEIGVSL